MGYRNYIGKVSKETYLEVKDMMEKELVRKYGHDNVEDEEDSYFEPFSHLKVQELYECGKYCDERTTISRFFTNKLEHESDTEFWMASKELLLEIIESYRQKVASYYRNLYEKKDESEIHVHFKEMVSEWERMRPYCLTEETPKVVNSWKYEYAVFELTRILKTFDWENDVLVYYGH
jgi:hypothetical protein